MKRSRTAPATMCRCLHVQGDHSRNEGECLLDDCACDLFRAKGVKVAASANGYPLGHGRRTHKPVALGDKFGPWRIVAILGRGHMGRSDLRVAAECSCGRRSETYEFNLRAYRHTRCSHRRQQGELTGVR